MLFLCAAILCCAFIAPKTGNIADAAVKPDVAPNKVSYTATDYKQYRHPTQKDSLASVPYSLFEAVNDEYGVVTFDAETKTATLNKLDIGFYQLANYIAFESEITVPALTEYSIDYTFTLNYKRTANSQSSTVVGMGVYYYGNTHDDPNACDKSELMTLKAGTSGENSPAEYAVGDFYATSNTARTNTVVLPTLTYTNNTEEEVTFTAFFGVISYGSAGSTYKNTNVTSLVMSDELTVTSIEAPKVDKNSADYNEEGNTFNFTYDHDRIKLSSVIFKGKTGISTDIIDEVSISDSGECILYDRGTYTFYFDIVDYCGAVWNSETNDQSTQKVEVTINTATATVPYIGNPSKEYTGSELTFPFMDFDSDLVKVDKITASNSANSAMFDAGTQNFKATNADTYTVTLKLVDEDNYVWDDEEGGYGERTLQFKITQKELTLTFESSSVNALGQAEWKADDEDVTITVTENSVEGDELSFLFYYDSQGNLLDGTPAEKSTVLDMKGIKSGEHTLFVTFKNQTGANANYTIKNGSYPFNVKAGSAQTEFDWIYSENGTKKGAIEEGGKLSYKKDTTYSVEVDLPEGFELNGEYAAQSGSAVKAYTTTVEIKSTDGTLFYDEEGNSSETTTVTLNWSIVQAEVDLSKVTFEYNDGVNGWQTYDPNDPPQYTELNFSVRVPSSNYPDGVTAVDIVYGEDRKGPGTISFDLEFTLDGNYKSSTGETTVQYTMELTGKKVEVSWVLTDLKDADGNEVKDDNGITYQVYVLDLDPTDPVYPYINYEYYTVDGSTYGEIISGGIDTIIAPVDEGGLGAGREGKTVSVYVRAYIGTNADGKPAPTTNGVANYILDFGVQSEYKKMTVGENKDPVDLTAGKVTSIVYGNGVTVSDLYSLTVRATENALSPSFYTVALYKGTTLINKDINEVDFSKLAAGTDYKLAFALTESASESYALTSTSLNFTVKPVELTVPTLKDGVTLTFNGETQSILSSLDNWNATYMEFASNSFHEARNAGSYSVVINIKEEYAGNYIFVLPESEAEPVKAIVRYALADEELPELSNNSSTASFKWTIEKYVIDTTVSSAWNFSANGASLNLPNWVKALTAGEAPSLNVQTIYYDTEGNALTEYELKGGNNFLVAAYIDPACADYGNFEFKGARIDPMGITTSPQTSYTVPMSGAAAFIGNVKEFMTKTWLGLPIWAWFAIGLAVLILLIIIIAVACKRRKSKEEREEAKARKEEEKARREEERRLQQERLEAERELARAKQEAELEKIRAQAGMAAGAGMAMQHQPVQQQTPMQPQQAQPVQMQPVQSVQQQAQQIPQYAPVSQPQYAPQQFPSSFNMADVNAIAEAKAAQAIAEAKAAQAQARAAEAIAEAKAAQAVAGIAPWHGGQNYGYSNQQQPYMQAPNQQPIVIVVDSNGQVKSVQQINQPQQQMYQPIFITANADSAEAHKPAELPQVTEESKNSASATYPPDAVITTTTTVDTTKKSSAVRGESLNDGRLFDIDGFYDNFENK